MSGLVHFPAFRRYDDARVAANDAMVALILGVESVQNELARAPAALGRQRLSHVVPHLSSATRLDQDVDRASKVLASAETHLASMSIPYILSVYERFLLETLAMLRSAELDSTIGTVKLSELHGHLETALGMKLEPDYIKLFAAINSLRNRLVHHGGLANTNLRTSWTTITKRQKERWAAFSGQPMPMIEVGRRVALGAGELFGVLAVTLHLAWELNRALQVSLSRDCWARVAIDDFASVNKRRFNDPTRRVAGTRGYARVLYGVLNLTEAEIVRNLP